MAAANRKSQENTSDREIIISPDFDAPRELVFMMWTNAEHLDKWWGPKGFTTTTQNMNAHVGGFWRYTMVGPDGTVFPNYVRYTKVVAPSRLEYDHGADDENDPWFLVTTTFETIGKKTRVTMRSLFPTAEARDHVVKVFGAIEGGKQTLERAAEHLAHLTSTKPKAMGVTLTRVFDAPRELVFKVWTDPKHVAKWWGPHGFTNPTCVWEAKVGGKIDVAMTWQDGTAHPVRGVVREIKAPERLVFETRAFFDENGVPQIEGLNTVTFTEENGKTRVTLEATLTKLAPQFAGAADGASEGWGQSLERFNSVIAAEQKTGLSTMRSPTEYFYTRVFKAPRALVFDAWTKPEHVRNWYGLRSLKMLSCEIDLRVGGKWRYVMQSPDGHTFAFSGEFKDVTAPERLSYSWWFEGMPDAKTVETLTFEETNGVTKLSAKTVFPSPDHLEGWAQSGGERGMVETLDRLEELLAGLN